MQAPLPDKPEEPTARRPQGVDAVDVAITLLRTILGSDRPLRLKEIEQLSGIASAKAYRYLVSLVEGGLVQRVDHHRYDFGLLAYQIAQRAAHLGRTQLEPLVIDELRQHDTPSDTATLEAYYAQLEQIRQAGIAQAEGLRIPGLSSLSVPVFDHEGKLAVVVTAVGYSPTFQAQPDGPTAQALRAFGHRLTAMLGGR